MRGCFRGERAWLLRGHAWFFPVGGHAWFFLGGACVVLGGVHRIRRDTVNERTVRILPECILVMNIIELTKATVINIRYYTLIYGCALFAPQVFCTLPFSDILGSIVNMLVNPYNLIWTVPFGLLKQFELIFKFMYIYISVTKYRSIYKLFSKDIYSIDYVERIILYTYIHSPFISASQERFIYPLQLLLSTNFLIN